MQHRTLRVCLATGLAVGAAVLATLVHAAQSSDETQGRWAVIERTVKELIGYLETRLDAAQVEPHSFEHTFPADGEYTLTIGELAEGRLVPRMEFNNAVLVLGCFACSMRLKQT